jgi:hypothetical protein
MYLRNKGSFMQILTIPANYDIWLTGLKSYLDRNRGSKADLARFLEKTLDIQFKGAVVKVSRLLAREFVPSAETFLDIAAWLQRQTDALSDPPHFTPLPPTPADRTPPSTHWREGGQDHRHSTRVAEDPPKPNSQAS